MDVSLYTDWCVAEPRRHLCESQGARGGGGGDFSASTVLGGSVTQQVNLIAEERRRATEQTDPHIFCLHSQTSVKQGLVC